ncbi:hypothetical protein Tco_1434461, partial [Tanacetum coccineum]
TMPNTRSRATMTRGHGGGNRNGGVNENGNGGGNINGNDNGNGNGNGGGNGYNFGEMYCPRNKIQKMEAELMVPNEEDKVKRFIGGLPDNIQGNVIVAKPTRLQDAIRVANNLMDQKLKGNARNAENKRRFENNSRDNRGQQPSFKRQNVRGQNVARAYMARNNERKGYVRSFPYCNKCRLYHEGSCTMRYGNCKRVSHMNRDCTAAVALNTHRASVRNQPGVVCYECGRPRHYRKDSQKLRNQNCRTKTRNKIGNKTGGNEATTKAYATGGGGVNPDSNVIMGTFLLNNCYASMLFDSGADRSFMSSTFSALLDVRAVNEPNEHEWSLLAKYHAVIVCDEKIIRIPYADEMLIIRAQVTSKKTKDKSEEKRLKDVLIVQEFSKVFPDDLPGLPPARQVEFKIDLVPGTAPIARAP